MDWPGSTFSGNRNKGRRDRMKEGREDGDNEGVTILIYLEGIFRNQAFIWHNITSCSCCCGGRCAGWVVLPLAPRRRPQEEPTCSTKAHGNSCFSIRHRSAPSLPKPSRSRRAIYSIPTIDTRTGCMKVKRLLDEITRPSTKGIRLKFNHTARGFMPIAREVSAPWRGQF
jgi:hypothetical protein